MVNKYSFTRGTGEETGEVVSLWDKCKVRICIFPSLCPW